MTMEGTRKMRRVTRAGRGLFGAVAQNHGAPAVTKSDSSISKSQMSISGSAQAPEADNQPIPINNTGIATPAALSAADVSVEHGSGGSTDSEKEITDGVSGSQAQVQGGVDTTSNVSNGNEEDLPDELNKYTPGAYMQREEDFIKRERCGEYTFPYVLNDGQEENFRWLVSLKGVYSRQLPNMPKEYICRLVLNRNHRSVAILKQDKSVLGGITYRTFPGQTFGEIAFCAVVGTEQVKGFGTRLMNHTKGYAKSRDGITHFLTYADNNAVGYFLKQGFTKDISLDRSCWSGYIKDYDGGTLMEFVFHKELPYTNLPRMIRKQRALLDSNIREKSKSHVEHPGLTHNGKRKAIAIIDIPGVKEAGWKPITGELPKVKLRDRWVLATKDAIQSFAQNLLSDVVKLPDSWPFREPVDANDVPDYYDLVKDPVDLLKMQTRLDSQQYYLTLDIVLADFKLMFDNCRFYNSPETVYYKLAIRLQGFVEDYFRKHTTSSK